jgi:DtxR family Mn-dependent transcriptional regulator
MTTPSVSIEDYVGAIYRLQNGNNDLLPLSGLQDFFGFSPISIHEMVQKLAQRGLTEYQPYKGVKLTQLGKETAEALIRRHRIWECFLANELHVPLEEVHQLAGNLEHVTPDWISERLFKYMDEPGFCPHGSIIGDPVQVSTGFQLGKAKDG